MDENLKHVGFVAFLMFGNNNLNVERSIVKLDGLMLD